MALQVSKGGAFPEQQFDISGSSVEEIIQKMRIMHLDSLINDFLLRECLSWSSAREVMSRHLRVKGKSEVIKIFRKYFKCSSHEHYHLHEALEGQNQGHSGEAHFQLKQFRESGRFSKKFQKATPSVGFHLQMCIQMNHRYHLLVGRNPRGWRKKERTFPALTNCLGVSSVLQTNVSGKRPDDFLGPLQDAKIVGKMNFWLGCKWNHKTKHV